MSPFHNKGWPYFDKFLDIIPNASARGGNSFSAIRTAPPVTIPFNDAPEPQADDPTIVDETSTNDNTLINAIDIDQHIPATTSNSFGKRKLDVIASDEELNAPGDPIPSSKPTPTTHQMRTKKKTSSLSSRSLPKSRNTSSSHSSQAPRSQSTSTKMTPALIAHEIQGSINSLASAVRDSGLTDPVANLRQEAIHHVSDDGDLSGIDKLTIIDLFQREYAAVQTYVALLKHDDIRKLWLQKQLEG